MRPMPGNRRKFQSARKWISRPPRCRISTAGTSSASRRVLWFRTRMNGSLFGSTCSSPERTRTWLRPRNAKARTSHRSPSPISGIGRRKMSPKGGGSQREGSASNGNDIAVHRAQEMVVRWPAPNRLHVCVTVSARISDRFAIPLRHSVRICASVAAALQAYS